MSQSIKDAWLNILGQRLIVVSDEAISRIPPDLEPSVIQTGYLHLDQPDRGSLLRSSGKSLQNSLGPRWGHRINSQKLADAIREILSNDLMRQKAKDVSKMIDRHNSLDMPVCEVLKQQPKYLAASEIKLD